MLPIDPTTPPAFSDKISFWAKSFLLLVAVLYAVPQFARAVVKIANALSAFARVVPHLEKLPVWMETMNQWMVDHQKEDKKTFGEIKLTLSQQNDVLEQINQKSEEAATAATQVNKTLTTDATKAREAAAVVAKAVRAVLVTESAKRSEAMEEIATGVKDVLAMAKEAAHGSDEKATK